MSRNVFESNQKTLGYQRINDGYSLCLPCADRFGPAVLDVSHWVPIREFDDGWVVEWCSRCLGRIDHV